MTESGQSPQPSVEFAKSRTKLLTTLVSAAIACTVISQIMGDSSITSSILALTTSGLASALSIQVIYRQKVTGLFPKMYASLGLALGLWFAAEAVWAYYENVVGIETPFPSVADIFWLAGYVPFFYFLIGIVKYFTRVSRSSLLPLFTISTIGFVLLGNILMSIYQSAELTSQDGIISFLVGSAYPVADMFLIIPAVAAFVQLRKGQLTFTPWLLIVMATIVFIVGDVGFAYSTSIDEMADMIWVWNPLYNIGNIAIACSLFWHKSFFTIDEKKLIRIWQEKNR